MTLTTSRAKAVHKSSIPIKVEFVLHWVYILRGLGRIHIPFPSINLAITFFFILSYPLGKIKGKLIHFKMYVFRRTAEKGQQLSFGCNDYLFGNAVNIKNRFSFAKKENSALSEHTCLTNHIIGWDNSKNNTTNRCTNIEIF